MIRSRRTIAAAVLALALAWAASPAVAGDVLAYRAMGDDTPQEQKAEPAAQQKPFKKKKVLLAFLMSAVIPSSGQFYNGEKEKGAVMASLVIGGLVIHKMTTGADDKTSLGDPGMIILISAWAWSMFDAPISALRINNEHEQNAQIPAALAPHKGWDLYAGVAPGSGAGAGVRLRF